MADASLMPGHVILLVRMQGDRSTTHAEVEARAIDWLADALGAEASRRSAVGEYVVGAANPVTIVPLLGLTDRELATREASMCQGNATPFLGFLPRGPNVGALVHIDWGGVPSTLPTRWRLAFEGALLERWEPTTGEAPDLAVTAVCAQSERAREPIEPPTLADELPELPERPDIPRLFGTYSHVIGLLAVGVVGFAVWQGWKRGQKRP